jgi:uncharacterized membrane protein YfcA
MMRNRKPEAIQSLVSDSLKVCPLRVPYSRVLFDGFFVGALTGMVGVGGGFLIVPALTLLVGFPIKGAVGTSLLVIAMNAVAGLAGYSQHISLDLELTAIVTSGSIVGSAIGALVSAYVKPVLLRRVFGLMVILIAGYILSQSITMQFIKTVDQWFIYPEGLKWLLMGLIILLLLLGIGSWIHKADVVIPLHPKPDS